MRNSLLIQPTGRATPINATTGNYRRMSCKRRKFDTLLQVSPAHLFMVGLTQPCMLAYRARLAPRYRPVETRITTPDGSRSISRFISHGLWGIGGAPATGPH